MAASEDEARSFAAAFRSFLDWVHAGWDDDRQNEVVGLVGAFLGDRASHSVVTRSLPVFEHVNLQTALDAWLREPGRTADIRGITIPPHYPPVNLQQLVTGQSIPPLRLSAPPLVDL